MAETFPDAALDELIEAVSARDIGRTLGGLSLANDPAIVGSEEGESALGWDAAEAFFTRIYQRSLGFRFEFPRRRWSLHGDVAWLVADGTVIDPGATGPKPYRLTAVFVREGTTWQLSLWSGAEPVPAHPM